eukprot:scaffold164688_cov42-Prasinocladus_malaysianus.AAC.1
MPKAAARNADAELAEKDLALRGIQRNYDSLSSLMQAKHQQVQQAESGRLDIIMAIFSAI